MSQGQTNNTASLTAQFDLAATGISRQFALNVDDVRSAYAAKQDSLTTLFKTASEARSDRNSYIGWSVFWGIFIWPIALYTGYKAYDNHARLQDVKQTVQDELSLFRSANNGKPQGPIRLSQKTPA